MAIDIALILVSVPVADIREGRFDAEISLEELRYLLHIVPECGWILSTVLRLILLRICGL